MELLEIIRLFFGSVYFLLFLPGFFLALLFFRRPEAGYCERIVISFCLSLATVPLIALIIKLTDQVITAPNIFLGIIIFDLIAVSLYLLMKKISWSK